MTGARRTALLWASVIALPLLVLTAKMPSHPQILAVLGDAAHAPVFAAFAVVVLLLLRPLITAAPVRYLSAFVIAAAVGGMLELIQPFIGRDAQGSDFARDALGAIVGLALAAWCNAHGGAVAPSRSHRGAMALVGLLAAAPVLWPVAEAGIAYGIRAARFPTLLIGGSSPDRYFMRLRGVSAQAARLPEPWARPDDSMSLRVQIAGGRWPSVTHAEPASNWLGHSRLMLDLTNPDARPLALNLRVHDRWHDNEAADRFNHALVLAGHTRAVIAIPLADIRAAPVGRELDLAEVAGLIVYADGGTNAAGREFYLTRVWLE